MVFLSVLLQRISCLALASLVVVWCFVALSPALSYAQDTKEYQLKSVFIYNFLKLITWPPDIELNEITVCILGDNPFGKSIDGLASKTVRKKPISVRTFVTMSDSHNCNVVFVSQSESSNISSILTQLSKHPIVTISDINMFVQRGGIIEFIQKNSTIGIHINLQAARQSNLSINAKLLEFAEDVL